MSALSAMPVLATAISAVTADPSSTQPRDMRASTAYVNVHMQESALRTHARSTEIRPHNKSKAYRGPQAEFTAWCEAKGFADGSTVTGNKLHLFLEGVIGRSSKIRKRNSD